MGKTRLALEYAWGHADTYGALLLVDAQGHRELPRAPKSELGRQLVAEIARRLGEAGAPRS